MSAVPLTFRGQAMLQLPFDRLAPLFAHLADDHGLTLHRDGSTQWVEAGPGRFGAIPVPDGSCLFVTADSADWLFTLQESAAEHLAELLPGLAIEWTGAAPAGALPPNFTLARVVTVQRLSESFLRLRLEGDGMARLDHEMIHFGLCLPAPGGDWPRGAAGGRTVWPAGMHRPAYTVSALDAAAGWLETDVFLHEGGRACAFAGAAAPGAEVGLHGPGGGGIPIADDLVIAGDETAYPAMARIIAAQAPRSRIVATALGRTADYPFPPHPGLTLDHAPRDEAGLAARLTASACAAAYWIATERSRLPALKRAILDDLGVPKSHAHIAAYWSKTGDPR